MGFGLGFEVGLFVLGESGILGFDFCVSGIG